MRNKYGKEQMRLPSEKTFKKWLISLGPDKLRAAHKEMPAHLPLLSPVAEFLRQHFGATSVNAQLNYCGISKNGKYQEYKNPKWASQFIQDYESGKIPNLRQWALK